MKPQRTQDFFLQLRSIAVADVLAARHPAKLVKIGVNDEFGHSGPAVDLLKEYGLCADNIVAKARDAVKAK